MKKVNNKRNELYKFILQSKKCGISPKMEFWLNMKLDLKRENGKHLVAITVEKYKLKGD